MKIMAITNVNDASNLRMMINQIGRQVSDNTGEITLSDGTVTVVNNNKVFAETVFNLVPRNEAAADTKWFIHSKSNGRIEIRHTAGTNRIFDYVINGSL